MCIWAWHARKSPWSLALIWPTTRVRGVGVDFTPPEWCVPGPGNATKSPWSLALIVTDNQSGGVRGGISTPVGVMRFWAWQRSKKPLELSSHRCNTLSTWKHTRRIPTPATEMNYYPKVLPSMQKWRGSTDPITKRSRAKVRTAPGMVLDTVKPTFQSIVQNPPFKTKQDFSPSDGPRKTKLLACLTRITIATTQIIYVYLMCTLSLIGMMWWFRVPII